MHRSFSLFLLALLSLSAPAWASVIYVSGDQTGTWAADTVIVTAEVRVPPGQFLTIQPGVEVLFSVYCKLIVDSAATLRAVGTPTDSICFDVLPPNTTWNGIRFLSASDSSRLVYCLLTHGWASGSGEDLKGGAIFCYNSSPNISHNTISDNSSYIDPYSGGGMGGGIYCETASFPTISGNIISGNSAGFIGGALGGLGGGIYAESSPTISQNTITGNSAAGGWLDGSAGGAIYCTGCNPLISGNTICGNSSEYWEGGGIYCNLLSSPTISGNIINDNVGGGIFCGSNCSPIISDNTISGNTSMFSGGIFCYNSSPTLVNCILWGNIPQQIYVQTGSPQVTYSDIQGGYTGMGNIATYPAFVDTAQDDYRLQWGSPCIDTGDPNAIYNDPDGSRADMGAWYYDQTMPVRILLTPYNAPIQIPASGGSFQYAIQATNIATSPLLVPVWCNVTLPSGVIYGPVLGPVTISLGAGQTLSRVRAQAVPAYAPAGMYYFNAYAVAAGDTSEDSFVFTKSGAGFGESGLSGGWTNTGEALDVPLPSQAIRPRPVD